MIRKLGTALMLVFARVEKPCLKKKNNKERKFGKQMRVDKVMENMRRGLCELLKDRKMSFFNYTAIENQPGRRLEYWMARNGSRSSKELQRSCNKCLQSSPVSKDTSGRLEGKEVR